MSARFNAFNFKVLCKWCVFKRAFGGPICVAAVGKAIKEGTPTKEKYVGTWNSPNIVPIYNLSLFVTCQLQSHFFSAVAGITI
jgi:hypothetical protein